MSGKLRLCTVQFYYWEKRLSGKMLLLMQYTILHLEKTDHLYRSIVVQYQKPLLIVNFLVMKKVQLPGHSHKKEDALNELIRKRFFKMKLGNFRSLPNYGSSKLCRIRKSSELKAMKPFIWIFVSLPLPTEIWENG